MDIHYPTDAALLRSEIAAAAARMIAQDGADYASAKRRAAEQILGRSKTRKVRGEILPDNAQIEEEVRIYHALFSGDSQPARLLHLRQIAQRLMQDLAPFNPHLTGAVLNGSAGEHSDLHLQLFTDNPKDVALFLLNKDVSFEVSEAPRSQHRPARDPVETLSFLWHNEGVHLAIYGPDDLRGSNKSKSERANLAALQALIAESQSDET
ncbi:hypothetical protein [Herminiimonas sp. CN]|uniref:hypothetical protein n=1 Tax=Herminiimonas sp. CN TaxID=1349818 RepID=UPI0005539818|nr:hypothetical protein [Herminiimonas sp. CN]